MDCRSCLHHLQGVLGVQGESPSSFESFLRKYSSAKVATERSTLLNEAFDLTKYYLAEGEQNSDEYSSSQLLIEVFRDALEFSLNKGFSCSEMNHFLTLYLHTLSIVADEAHSEQCVSMTLPHVLEKFKRSALECSDKLTHSHLSNAVSYITDTIFKHYRLYQYLLTQEQPMDLTTVVLDLPHPLTPQTLNEAQLEQEWIKSEQRASLELRQEREQKEFIEACDVVSKEEEDKLKSVYQNELAKVAGQSEFTEEEVKSVIESLTAAHLQSAKVALSQTVQRQTMLLEMKTERIELLSPRNKPTSKEE